MGGYASRFLSLFKGKDPKTPVKGCKPRLQNIAVRNFRGLVGFFVPLCLLSWQGELGKHNITVRCMWWWIFWFYLWQPVSIPVTGIIPIFLLPMAGVMSTSATCDCYLNAGVLLFILSSMLLLLLNNSGVDRRIALWILNYGNSDCQFSSQKIAVKCCTAAFILSIFCSKLIVSSFLTQLMSSVISPMKGAQADFKLVSHIICIAIETSCSIGSIVLLHGSTPLLAFRTIFEESAPKNAPYPDIFNYFEYTIFAFPVAFVMFLFNCIYFIYLLNNVTKDASIADKSSIRSALINHRKSIPAKTSLHEKLSVLFLIFYLLMFFFRYNKYMKGWADFSIDETTSIPGVRDSTSATIFVILLHVLPNGFGFLKFISAEKKSQLPPIKPESGILWWRFVDKNINYGYMFLFGCGVALVKSSALSGLSADLSTNYGLIITDNSWNASIFIVALLAMILGNIMPGTAACVVSVPFILGASGAGAPDIWIKYSYLGAMAIGIGTSLGFMTPFLYTPAYFTHYTGKVPKMIMAKYSIGSFIICLIILWLSLAFYAPALWDPAGAGILPAPAAADAGGGGGAPAAPEAPPAFIL